MKPGDKLRIRGAGGNETTITVGTVFDARVIQGRLDSGEWMLVEDKPKRQPKPKTEE